MSMIGILNMYTMKLQIAAKLKVQNEKEIISYSDLGNAVLGQKGKSFVDFCLIVSQVGFCIAYFLYIGNQLDQVVCFETY